MLCRTHIIEWLVFNGTNEMTDQKHIQNLLKCLRFAIPKLEELLEKEKANGADIELLNRMEINLAITRSHFKNAEKYLQPSDHPLTPEELQIAKLMGMSADEYRQNKGRLAELPSRPKVDNIYLSAEERQECQEKGIPVVDYARKKIDDMLKESDLNDD